MPSLLWRLATKSSGFHSQDVEGGYFAGMITANKGKPDRQELYTCSRHLAEQFFIYSLAGLVAEALFSPAPKPDAWMHAAYPKGDIGYIYEWMEHWAPGDLTRYWETMRARTEAFLQPRQRKVELIATALVRRREMDGEAVSQALRIETTSPAAGRTGAGL